MQILLSLPLTDGLPAVFSRRYVCRYANTYVNEEVCRDGRGWTKQIHFSPTSKLSLMRLADNHCFALIAKKGQIASLNLNQSTHFQQFDLTAHFCSVPTQQRASPPFRVSSALFARGATSLMSSVPPLLQQVSASPTPTPALLSGLCRPKWIASALLGLSARCCPSPNPQQPQQIDATPFCADFISLKSLAPFPVLILKIPSTCS